MTILELINAQCRVLGVPEKYAAKIQKLFKIEKDEGISDYVQMYKDNILPDVQAGESAQSAVQKAIADYEKKHNLKDGKIIEAKKEDKVDTDALSPEIKALIDAQSTQIAALTTAIKGITSTISTSQKQVEAKATFENAKLPAKWFGRIDVNSETPIEDQIKELETEYAELKQSIINDEVEAGDYKPRAGAPKDRTEAEWAKFMDGDGGNAKDSSVASLGLDN
ncbi:hypothetical protein [Bacteroides neonati]|uniref:hypothetical protein n=1 Tax=Bacteroides neonati TaxID=1347393 RepID=UPI0004BA38BC|nr:hypothetical protein [Bacteroides neonati]